MTDTIHINLPQEVINLISDKREEINDKLMELLILELYREHKISSGKAAEILNITKANFIYLTSAKGIAHIDISQEEMEQDYQNLKAVLNKHNSK